MRRRGWSRGSFQKKQREAAKRQRRLQKGKPAGEPALKTKAAKPKTLWVELRQIGGSWFPKLTVEALAKLKKGEHPNIGNYAFVKDQVSSTKTRIVFEVQFKADLTSKDRKWFGRFMIDLENKTIKKIEETVRKSYPYGKYEEEY